MTPLKTGKKKQMMNHAPLPVLWIPSSKILLPSKLAKTKQENKIMEPCPAAYYMDPKQ